jgi:hypothetical protein
MSPSRGGAVERVTLFDFAKRLVAIYQASDADALHSILAPELQPDFSPPALSRWLTQARNTFGMLRRTSMPTYGSRTHGVLAAYFDRAPADMYLEMNQQEKLVLWVLKSGNNMLSIRKRA